MCSGKFKAQYIIYNKYKTGEWLAGWTDRQHKQAGEGFLYNPTVSNTQSYSSDRPGKGLSSFLKPHCPYCGASFLRSHSLGI